MFKKLKKALNVIDYDVVHVYADRERLNKLSGDEVARVLKDSNPATLEYINQKILKNNEKIEKKRRDDEWKEKRKQSDIENKMKEGREAIKSFLDEHCDSFFITLLRKEEDDAQALENTFRQYSKKGMFTKYDRKVFTDILDQLYDTYDSFIKTNKEEFISATVDYYRLVNFVDMYQCRECKLIYPKDMEACASCGCPSHLSKEYINFCLSCGYKADSTEPFCYMCEGKISNFKPLFNDEESIEAVFNEYFHILVQGYAETMKALKSFCQKIQNANEDHPHDNDERLYEKKRAERKFLRAFDLHFKDFIPDIGESYQDLRKDDELPKPESVESVGDIDDYYGG